MKALYQPAFAKEPLMVEVQTWTNGKEDKTPKRAWKATLWVERGEDWYALCNRDFARGTVRVVTREMWLAAREPEASK